LGNHQSAYRAAALLKHSTNMQEDKRKIMDLIEAENIAPQYCKVSTLDQLKTDSLSFTEEREFDVQCNQPDSMPIEEKDFPLEN
jgi:hypothetical protein